MRRDRETSSQVTTTSAEIDVEDVNDNYPKFELEEYLRVVEEGDTSFRPPLVIQVGPEFKDILRPLNF